MKIKYLKLVFSITIFFVTIAITSYGDENSTMSGEVSVPDSMEIIKKGDVNVIVPKGQRLIKDSSFFVTENPDEYASRKFIEAEARDSKIEKELASLKAEFEDLKNTVSAIKEEQMKTGEKEAGKKVDI